MKNELLFKQDEMKKHTNQNKDYWKGSSLNLGDDKNNDWIDCNTVGRWKFDQKEPYSGKYYIEYWVNGNVSRLTDLTEEQHNDIRFEILDYLDKL